MQYIKTKLRKEVRGRVMVNQVKETVTKLKNAGKSKEKCNHHWILETPNGPTAIGRCKYCGEDREFYNTWPIAWSKN